MDMDCRPFEDALHLWIPRTFELLGGQQCAECFTYAAFGYAQRRELGERER